MKKFLWLFLLPFLLGAASQNTGWLTRSDCGTLTNAMTNGTVCLQTTTVSGRTAGHFYGWNGSAWIDVTGNIGAAITGLTGDITASGPGSVGATIGNTKVTLPKIQNAVSSNKLLGSGATGAGSSYSEISLGTNLSMSGTTLNASGGGGGTGCTTSGTSILQGDGLGGCSNVTVGTGLDFTGGTLSAPGVAPDSAHYVTTQAEAGLSAEFNLGGLTDGLLKQTVSGGVSTPAIATAGVDYPAPNGSGCTVYVPPGTNNIQAAINGLAATGGTICLGAGTYTQTGGPITLGDGTSSTQSTTYGIRIIGQSMPIMDLVNVITPSSATILDCTGTTNSDCLSLLGTQGWAIENLEIHGVGTGSNSVALKVTSSSFGHARNLRISGFNKGIWSTTWNSGSTTNHDSWGNLYDQITIFIATGGTHGFLIQGGDTVSNTDFNVLRSLNIFPPTGSVCMEFGFSDNNRTMDLNCIGTASGVDPTATSILFNYATGPREPLNNYFEGMDLSQHPIVNSGSPAENKPQLIFGFAEANSATCPNVVNVQVWGCSTSYAQQLRLSAGLQLWLGTGNAVTVNPITGTAAYNFNLPTGAGTAGQPLLSGGGGSNAQTYGTLGIAAGGTNLTAATDDNLMVGNGTTWESKALTNCTDTGGNHLNYATATNTFSCGTSSSGGGSVVFSPPGLRLTLTTGVPVTTSDVTAAGTLYYTPFKSCALVVVISSALANGCITEISLSLTLTSGKNYDVFVSCTNSTTCALALSSAWTDDTTRADALATETLCGCQVLGSDHTKLWIGTIRASGTNTTEDSVSKRFLWNTYNQVARNFLKRDSTTTWTYATGTWRSKNNSTANRVEVVVGNTSTLINIQNNGSIQLTSTDSGYGYIGIDEDGTSANDADTTYRGGGPPAGTAASISFGVSSVMKKYIPLGYHFYQAVEYAEIVSGSVTFIGDDATPFRFLGGLIGDSTQ